MFGYLWDLYQDERIANLNLETELARQAVGKSTENVTVLEAKLNRLELVCAAMHSLLQQKLGITDTELAARVKELDILDGKIDGRMKLPPTTCPKCNRTISGHRGYCIYCGK